MFTYKFGDISFYKITITSDVQYSIKGTLV